MSFADESSDRYRPQRILGEGGSGRVWLVEDSLRPGTPLALKELSDSGDGHARHEEALRREFATLSCLRHPNLVEVHEFHAGAAAERPRFTLEFIEGRNIVDAVADEGPDCFVELTVEALRALTFLHDFGLLHRDLKPDNLLVRDRPKLGCRLVLVDFGLALQPEDEPLESLLARGTLPYLAPEILANQGAGRRTDLYSLGAVLFEAVHGSPPFALQDRDLGSFVGLVSEGRRARPRIPAGYPERLDGWLDELLAPNPDERPADAAEALARLNAACATNHPAETPASRVARLLSGPPAERSDAVEEILGHLAPEAGPRVVWLCGGAGSGKSRVLRWLVAQAMQDGWDVVAPAHSPTGGLEELRARAERGPTLLLLDELESAGAGTVELIDRVARETDRPPLQVVAAVRPGQLQRPTLERLFADTGTVPTLRRVVLGPLGADGIRAIASRATGGAVSDERVRWLLETSEGSPAVAESLLVEEAWENSGRSRTPVTGATLPAGRLELLSESARGWLDAVAVLRSDVDESIAAELAALDATTARTAGEECSALGLVVRRAGRWQPESRALVEHVLSKLDPARRRALHRSAAELVETQSEGAADPWLRSRLWSEAGESDRAVECAVLAAERARAEGDAAEAAARFEHALRLLGRDRGRRHYLRLRQADALMQAGMHRLAIRAYRSAGGLAPDESTRRVALSGQALALVQAGRFDDALATASQAAALAESAGDAEQLARARKAAGIALGRLGREEQALPLLREARELVRDQGNLAAEAELLQVEATCRLRLGLDGAESEFSRSIELLRQARASGAGGSPGQEGKALIGLAVLKTRGGAHEEAALLLEEAQRIAVEHGQLNLREVALSKLAALATERGELDRAMHLAKQAADLALHLGEHNLIFVDRCRLADAQIRCGRPGQAVALLRDTLQQRLDHVEPQNVDYARMLLAAAWMESGNADEQDVEALLAESLSGVRARRQPRALMMNLALELERRSRPGCAAPFDPPSREFDTVARKAEETIEPEIRIRAELARAAYQLGRGNPHAAQVAAEWAATVAEENGAPAFHARASALLAEALDRLGREEQAAEALEHGRRSLDEAAGRIGAEDVRKDFLERPGFAGLGHGDFLTSRGNHERLLVLYDMIRLLNSESDTDALLESILDMALQAVQAERGMILLKDAPDDEDRGEFSVHLARNLDAETIKDVGAYSQNIVSAAGAGQSLLTFDAREDDRFSGFSSVSLYGIRSLMCVPLRSRGRIVGTVYIDSRRDGLLFTVEDLRFLEAFADQAGLALERSLERVRLERENRQLRALTETRSEFANLVGRSPGMQAVFDLIEKVASTELPVLIHGESGTGKEMVARAIHLHGPRRRGPFVSENCAALPETLLESELFGHVRGAFTGADRDHPGLFEQAHEGTLFLDEIGDMSAAMQARLLRVLQEGELRRVGGEKPIRVDVRVLTATHRELQAEVRAGRYREDLLYRLQVLTIELPPLRERPGDVALLCGHILEKIGRERGTPPATLSAEVLGLFDGYAWPGNVRQLENALQRLSLLAGGKSIGLESIRADGNLRQALLRDAPVPEPVFSLKLGEKEQLERALAAAGGNRARAAKLLGVSRATLYRKIKQHGI